MVFDNLKNLKSLLKPIPVKDQEKFLIALNERALKLYKTICNGFEDYPEANVTKIVKYEQILVLQFLLHLVMVLIMGFTSMMIKIASLILMMMIKQRLRLQSG